jgi:hypothetical protein
MTKEVIIKTRTTKQNAETIAMWLKNANALPWVVAGSSLGLTTSIYQRINADR